ncbi:MAG: 3-deoxy-D-manno-octulosonic acid transferase, partial [Magnetococcales bacterium]|nr:3-deoxy-D-manno-octulosonic acid transferase [Magnetococcales bacterium]
MFALYDALWVLTFLCLWPYWGWRHLASQKYRRTLPQRLGILTANTGWPPGNDLPGPPRIWIHAVSVGEVMAAKGLIANLDRLLPNHALVLSTTTKTGQELARSTLPQVKAFLYMPFDLRWCVGRAVDAIRPEVAIVMETELWPNLFRLLHNSGARIIVANGRISPRSFPRYRRLRPLMARLLAPIDLFAAQSEADAQRIAAIGLDPGKITVTGNIKFDQATRIPGPKEMAPLREKLGLSPTPPHPSSEASERSPRSSPPDPTLPPIWVAASTHPGEETTILEAHSQLRKRWPDLRLVLVPRHPERAESIAAIAGPAHGSMQTGCLFFSRECRHWTNQTLIVDQIGWLNRLYGLARFAFIGGSLVPHGGQNLLEAAAWSIPSLIGPHMFNFREPTNAILAANGAIQIDSADSLVRAADSLLDDPALCQTMGHNARETISRHTGALDRTLAAIHRLANTGNDRPPS